MKRMSWLFAAMACCLFPIAASAAGATLYVDDDAPNDPGPGDPFVSNPAEDGSPQHPFDAIQEAIDAAVPGDTVIVAEGTYHENILFDGKDIVLRSTNPDDPGVVARTIIWARRGMSAVAFLGTETEACLLAGLTIGNGRSGCGGGIYGGNAKPTIANCVVRDNLAIEDGGGLYGCHGLITGCTVTRNRAEGLVTNIGKGGGLHHCDGAILRCAISENSARWEGGGLSGCDGLIMDCEISRNDCCYYGGGVANCTGAVVACGVNDNLTMGPGAGGGLYRCAVVIDSVVSRNSGGKYGGGLMECSSVVGCEVAGNSASLDGGGANSCASLSNCVVRLNRTEEFGGGLNSCGDVTNCTVVGNAAQYGGGVANPGFSIVNSIIWGNIVGNCCRDLYSGRPDLSYTYSCVGDANVDLGEGCIRSDPNLDSDCRPLPGSPCIDAANGDVAPLFDLDGNPRHDDLGIHPNKGVGSPNYCDTGAYEFQGDTPLVGDVNEDHFVNVADLLIVRNNLGKGSPGSTASGLFNADINRDGIVNVADLLIVRNNLGCGGGCR